ncbi:MAG TPA: cytochrome c [Nitrospiria bacterium]|jgi:mono/diheme cytochrome c family protein|nr:cytochrome c [Nitrospiria bacterium]
MGGKFSLRIRVELVLVGVVFSATLLTPEISLGLEGAKVFADKCIACHGSKGEGTQVGPALKGDPFVIEGTAAEIKHVITSGRTQEEKKYPKIVTPMPGGLASADEADALIIYLKGDLQKK